jgi:hypothetical protein
MNLIQRSLINKTAQDNCPDVVFRRFCFLVCESTGIERKQGSRKKRKLKAPCSGQGIEFVIWQVLLHLECYVPIEASVSSWFCV